jgi:hypothetical protein
MRPKFHGNAGAAPARDRRFARRRAGRGPLLFEQAIRLYRQLIVNAAAR